MMLKKVFILVAMIDYYTTYRWHIRCIHVAEKIKLCHILTFCASWVRSVRWLKYFFSRVLTVMWFWLSVYLYILSADALVQTIVSTCIYTLEEERDFFNVCTPKSYKGMHYSFHLRYLCPNFVGAGTCQNKQSSKGMWFLTHTRMLYKKKWNTILSARIIINVVWYKQWYFCDSTYCNCQVYF